MNNYLAEGESEIWLLHSSAEGFEDPGGGAVDAANVKDCTSDPNWLSSRLSKDSKPELLREMRPWWICRQLRVCGHRRDGLGEKN
jgi:hypothetical protein